MPRLEVTQSSGKSPANLRKFRAFYEAYPGELGASPLESSPPSRRAAEIQQMPSVESFLLQALDL